MLTPSLRLGALTKYRRTTFRPSTRQPDFRPQPRRAFTASKPLASVDAENSARRPGATREIPWEGRPPMSPTSQPKAHVIVGGFPPKALGGHDMDYARLRLLELLEERDVLSSVGNDFRDIERWLPDSQLLITYLAGPFLDDHQNAIVRDWLAAGGHWLGLHGSAGGKAARMGDGRRRRMVKTSHHETLGGFFINHPPMRRFTVSVADTNDVFTKDLPASFETIDEPYMIEIQSPSDTHVLLTAELGPDNSPPGFGFDYEQDTSLAPDGKTRVLGYTRNFGNGGVAYIALGHCHSPASNIQTMVDTTVDPAGVTPTTLRVTWESDAYMQLLRNAIDWGIGGGL